MPRISDLYRYPVKGLAGERLEDIRLAPGQPVPGDRRWAIGHEGGAFDPAAPRHLSKAHFVTLLGAPELAALTVRHEDGTLALTAPEGRSARGDLETEEGRAAIEAFLADFLGEAVRAAPRLVGAEGLSLSDIPADHVSLINRETVKAVSDLAGIELDSTRFRGNLLVKGAPAWSEFDWLGREIEIGEVRLRAEARIGRCQAVSVDPATGSRNINLPKLLLEQFGHADCGLYLEVLTGGRIAPGDPLRLV